MSESRPDRGPLTEEDVELYQRLKEGVQQALRRNGSQFFEDKPEHGYVGLLNQGATCYLNSLLQSLFHTREVRERLFGWAYRREWDGPPDVSIPLQLQRLFARLAASAQPAVSTKSLTGSFGWEAADAFRQHDVQELFHVLFDALQHVAQKRRQRQEALARAREEQEEAENDKANDAIGSDEEPEDETPEAATEGPSLEDAPEVVAEGDALVMRDLFEGMVEDFVECRHSECGFRRSSKVPFLDLELGVAGSQALHTVEQSIEFLLANEVLSGSNRWHCDKCGVKRDANKGQRLVALPDVLLLQLKRFVFDLQAMRRVKLHDPYRFPEFLDMAPFLSRSGQPCANESDAQYQLYSVMVHMGTATGGHYFAYINPHAADGKGRVSSGGTPTEWFEFNDAHVRPLQGDALTHFRQVLSTNGGQWTPSSHKAAGDSGPQEASGHGIPTPADKETKTSPAAEPLARAAGVEGNAYMLMYRRIGSNQSERATDEESVAAGASPPAHVQEELDAENRTYMQLKRAYEIRQQMVECTIYGPRPMDAPFDPATGVATAAASQNATVASSSSSSPSLPRAVLDVPLDCTLGQLTERCVQALRASHPENATQLDRTLPDCIRLRHFVPSTGRPVDTLVDGPTTAADIRLAALGFGAAATLVLETKESSQEWQPYNPNEMILRVIQYQPQSGLDEQGQEPEEREETPASSTSPSLASSLTLAGSLQYMLCVVVRVEGEQRATVGGLQRAIAASPLQLPADSQRLWFMDGEDLRQLTDENAELKENYDVWPGADIVVEETLDADTPSRFRQHWEEEKNTITIMVNRLASADSKSVPGDPAEETERESSPVDAPVYDMPIVCKKTESLRDIKERVAKQLGLDVDDFHFRRSVRAPMLKDESVLAGPGWSRYSHRGRALGYKADGLELVDESVLHLGRGPPLRPDQHLLGVFLYDPSQKAKFRRIGELPASESDTVEWFKRVVRDILPRGENDAILPPSRIRLRQKKGKEAGRVFRDKLKLRQAIPRMEDGSEVAVQRLTEPEVIGSQDMILTFRRWDPERQKISPSLEVVVSKRCTVNALRRLIGMKYSLRPRDCDAADDIPDNWWSEHVGIAKHTQHGFPLNGRSANRLAWNPEAMDESQTLTELPLGLRDGVTVVCRDEDQFRRWAEAGKPGLADSSSSSSRGAAAAAAGGRRGGKPWQGKREAPGRSSREVGIRIRSDGPDQSNEAQMGHPWACPVCTFENEGVPLGLPQVCSMCGSKNE